MKKQSWSIFPESVITKHTGAEWGKTRQCLWKTLQKWSPPLSPQSWKLLSCTFSLFSLLRLVKTNWGLICLVQQYHPASQHAQEHAPWLCLVWLDQNLNELVTPVFTSQIQDKWLLWRKRSLLTQLNFCLWGLHNIKKKWCGISV